MIALHTMHLSLIFLEFCGYLCCIVIIFLLVSFTKYMKVAIGLKVIIVNTIILQSGQQTPLDIHKYGDVPKLQQF